MCSFALVHQTDPASAVLAASSRTGGISQRRLHAPASAGCAGARACPQVPAWACQVRLHRVSFALVLLQLASAVLTSYYAHSVTENFSPESLSTTLPRASGTTTSLSYDEPRLLTPPSPGRCGYGCIRKAGQHHRPRAVAQVVNRQMAERGTHKLSVPHGTFLTCAHGVLVP
jgi:hypothetical protein